MLISLVTRTMLHKRTGLAGRARERHPFYGLGADSVITDAQQVPVAAIERKTLEDLARVLAVRETGADPRIFRPLRELTMHLTPILLLEGTASAYSRRVEPGMLGLQFRAAREGIAILYSSGPSATAQAILDVARKPGKELGEGDSGSGDAPFDVSGT